MGRKKKHDRNEMLEKAMELFRDHGFTGTSAEMLAEGLGANRYSIYAEFGSKQGLFDAALQRYDDIVVHRNFSPLEARDAGLNEIAALFAFFGAASRGKASGRGCLLCNTATEFGPNDPSGERFVQRYFKRISNAFNNALKNAATRNELIDGIDCREEADFFTASVLGLFVMLRAKAPAATVERAVRVAIRTLQSIQCQNA